MYRERLNDSKVDSVSVWTDRKRSAVKAKKIDTAWCYNSRRAEREDPVSIHSAGRPRTPSALLSTDPRLPLSFHVCFRDTHCCLSRVAVATWFSELRSARARLFVRVLGLTVASLRSLIGMPIVDVMIAVCRPYEEQAALCLPHHTVSTFDQLPVPLSQAFKHRTPISEKTPDIRAVVLDKDNCFSVPQYVDVFKLHVHVVFRFNQLAAESLAGVDFNGDLVALKRWILISGCCDMVQRVAQRKG
nr:hypothetical protein CFP56_03093 [Quercus suber]